MRFNRPEITIFDVPLQFRVSRWKYFYLQSECYPYWWRSSRLWVRLGFYNCKNPIYWWRCQKLLHNKEEDPYTYKGKEGEPKFFTPRGTWE